MDIAAKLRPKLKDTKTLTRGGERVTVNLYDDGSTEVLPYGADKEKAVQVNTGSQIIAADPYTLQPMAGGATFDKTMTPGEAASNQIAQGQLAVSQGNLAVAQGNAATSRGTNGGCCRSRRESIPRSPTRSCVNCGLLVDAKLLDILVCPICKGDLLFEEARIICRACRKVYPIRDGIPVMLVSEAAEWTPPGGPGRA